MNIERIKKEIMATFDNPVGADKIYSRYANLKNALDRVSLDGMFLEFGVAAGHTINFISNIKKDKTIYGFDSWEGIPEDWYIKSSLGDPSKPAFFPKGSWKSDKPKVNSNVILVDGWFEDSLPEFLEQTPLKNIAFLHIDSDLYSSAKTIFKYLGPYIVRRTVIVFDEWHASDHEEKAFTEWLTETNKTASIIYTTNTGQVTAIIN